ncbi:MAG: hypothetical protein FJW66_06620 [Actinobacteria bacterium]|nr:hypothetical protein [Actinomycetota bacterium]
MEKKYLVFDLGASSIKTILFHFDGKSIVMEVLDKFENRPVLINNTIYWNIFELFSNIKTSIKNAVVRFGKIESLGIDGWGSDFCIFDKNKRMISNPVNYRDKDRVLHSEMLYSILPKKRIFELTGHIYTPLIDLFQLYSFAVLKSPEIKEGYRYLSIPDSLNFFLTGNMINEYTRATTSALVDQVEKKWEEEIIKIFGFSRNIFGEFIMPGNIVGELSESVCEELDIKAVRIMACASHDTASAVTGIPVSKEEKDWVFLSMGTWFCFGAETCEPVINDNVFSAGFANQAATEGKNLLFKNINGFWIIEKCKERWEKDAKNEITWEKIIDLSDKSKPFASFIDTDNTVFYNYHFDMPQKVRLFCKESGQKMPGTIGEIARCIFESLVFKIVYIVRSIEQILGYKVKVLYLMGGVTQNSFICQWIANAVNSIVIVCSSQSTSIGNCLMQLKADNEIGDLSEGRKIVHDSIRIKEYYPWDCEIWNKNYNDFHEKIIRNKEEIKFNP